MTMDLRLDDTGFGKIKILQDPDGFCYGVDAVLLADFAARCINGRRKRTDRIVDLGAGTGIVPLILSHKVEAGEICGIEVQDASFEIAEKNVEINGLTGRVHFYKGDVAELVKTSTINFDGKDVRESFDVVTSNPPYTVSASGVSCENSAKATARQETTADLADFVRLSFQLLRDKGDLFMVHRPSRLVDICEVCRKLHMEPKELRFVSGKPLEKPNIILVHCVKNGNRELKILKPLHVREENDAFSREINEIYERC